jgi:two-component system, NarL family, nitrate/nitrite response regulator NarL
MRDGRFLATCNADRRMAWNPEVMALRCLLVDDSSGFLQVARALLERQGIDVVGAASTGDEALRLVGELQPDVALVDIDLGPESGFDLARRLARETSLHRVILISTHSEDDFADLIAESPAIGFLSKSQLSATAIHELLGGDRGNEGVRT